MDFRNFFGKIDEFMLHLRDNHCDTCGSNQVVSLRKALAERLPGQSFMAAAATLHKLDQQQAYLQSIVHLGLHEPILMQTLQDWLR